MNKKINISILLGLIVLFGITGEVRAWTTTISNNEVKMEMVNSFPLNINHYIQGSAFWLAYVDLLAVRYHFQVLDTLTGISLASGSNIPVGKKITFHFVPHSYSDVTWAGAGGTNDSPYGDWSINATPPDSVSCNPNDLVNRVWISTVANAIYYPNSTAVNQYYLLKVNPPLKTVIDTNNLDCQSPKISGDVDCTVSAIGQISAKMNFASTIGKFYGRIGFWGPWYPTTDGNSATDESMCTSITSDPTTGNLCCLGDNDPLTYYNGSGQAPFILQVPAQTVPFTFTGTTGTAPTKPSITCPSSGAILNQSKTFSFSSNTSDNKTVIYGIDLDNNNIPDDWIPGSSPYVASGATQLYSHSWSSVNSANVKVIARDSAGFDSAWSDSCVIDVVDSKQCSDGSTIPVNQDCPVNIPSEPITIDARLTPNIVNRGSFCTATSTISNLITGTTCNIYKTGQESMVYNDQDNSKPDIQLEAGSRYIYICKDSSNIEVARSRELYCAINPSILER